MMQNINFGAAKAVTGFGNRKITISGNLSINLVNSEQYGKELQLQVYTQDRYLEERRFRSRGNNRWNRTEIFFTMQDLPQLIQALQIIARREGMRT